MRGQGLNTKAFGNMMPGGNIGNARFPRQMNRLLGNLAGEINLNTTDYRLFKHALCATRAPGQAIHHFCRITNHQWLALQLFGNLLRQFDERRR